MRELLLKLLNDSMMTQEKITGVVPEYFGTASDDAIFKKTVNCIYRIINSFLFKKLLTGKEGSNKIVNYTVILVRSEKISKNYQLHIIT